LSADEQVRLGLQSCRRVCARAPYLPERNEFAHNLASAHRGRRIIDRHFLAVDRRLGVRRWAQRWLLALALVMLLRRKCKAKSNYQSHYWQDFFDVHSKL